MRGVPHESESIAHALEPTVCISPPVVRHGREWLTGICVDVDVDVSVQLTDTQGKSCEWCDSVNQTGLKQVGEDVLWALVGLGKFWLRCMLHLISVVSALRFF